MSDVTTMRYPGLIIGSAVLLAGAQLLVAWQLAEDLAAFYSMALVSTAWFGSLFFVAAFTARPLVRVHAGARVLVRNRRYLGLGFAAIHFMHLVLIVLWAQQPEVVVDAPTLLFGGLAYGFAGLMAATSNDASVRTLGANWRRLHLTGSWYIWFIYTFTLAGAAVAGSPVSGLLALVFLAAVPLRIMSRRPPKEPAT